MKPLPWRAAAVVLCACGVYLGTLGHRLVWDDRVLLDTIKHSGFLSLLSGEFLHPGSGYYRPLVLTSLALDNQAARFFPASFHLTNVVLHGANSLLAYLLLEALISPVAATWGALLFALHPVSSEAVSFVSGRTDLWSAFFVFSLALAWVRGSTRDNGSGWRRGIGYAALFVLGAFAKETTFMLPAVLLAWDLFFIPGDTTTRPAWWRRNRLWLAVYATGFSVAFGLRFVAGAGFGKGLAHVGVDNFSGAVKHLASIPSLIATYARLLLVPWPLTASYADDMVQLTGSTLAAAVLLLAIAVVTAGKRSRRIGLLGLSWIVGFLLPVVGFVQFGGTIIAERYLYLPSFGLCALFGCGVARLSEGPRGRWAAPAAAGAVLAVCAVLAALQSAVWRNEITLFENAVKVSPRSLVARKNLSKAYREAGRLAESYRVYGDVLCEIRMYTQAIATYRLMIAAEGRETAESQRRLGRAFFGAAQYEEAVVCLRKALQSEPGDVTSWYYLGLAYPHLGNVAAARAALEEAVRLDGNDGEARQELDRLLANSDRAAPQPPAEPARRFTAPKP